MSDTHLVTGGTGKTGKRVAAQLRDRGVGVRIASRSTDPPLDWNDPDTWDAVLDGVGAMYLASTDGVTSTPDFVRRAVDAGVRRIVLLSARGVSTPGYFDDQEALAGQFLTAEAAVRDSGAAWAVVRPGWFMQNFDEGDFAQSVREGRLELSVGDGAAAWIDAEDIAAVAVALLVDGRHDGEIVELSGPRALTVPEALALISTATGRPVEYVAAPIESFRELLRSEGVDEGAITVAAAGFSAIRRGSEAPVLDGVRRVLGREPGTFEDFVARSVDAWR